MDPNWSEIGPDLDHTEASAAHAALRGYPAYRARLMSRQYAGCAASNMSKGGVPPVNYAARRRELAVAFRMIE